MNEPRILKFFLGANSPSGFASRFEQITDPSTLDRLFVLKGGPGSGKSTLMKKVGEEALKHVKEIEYIYCSSDLSSLDAVIIPHMACAVADGTLPHAIEPKFPGAFEQLVALGDCWDAKKLNEQRENIITTAEGISGLHRQACRYLAAASALMGDNSRAALQFTDMKKLDKTTNRIATRLFKPQNKPGSERVRLLSAVTDKGFHTFYETAKALATSIIMLEDDYAVSAPAILERLRRAALDTGHDIITCTSPLAPHDRIEHLFVPALSLGFMTKNRLVSPDIFPDRVINSRRFTDAKGLAAYKKRMTFNRRAAAQMLLHAEQAIREAKERHDLLEGYYCKSMDYQKLDALTQGLIDTILET